MWHMNGPIYYDLGSFIPESYELKFSISGHSYRFSYGEATVDDMLKLMLAEDEGKDFVDKSRVTVEAFLCKNLVEGDAKQLAEDLKIVPYKSKRGELDIMGILEAINGRFKKKEAVG